MSSRKSSVIWEYFTVDGTKESIAVCKICNIKLCRGSSAKAYSTSPLIQVSIYPPISGSGSGSGRIVNLISGTIRFQPDNKNCYPVHPYSDIKLHVDFHWIPRLMTLSGYSGLCFKAIISKMVLQNDENIHSFM